MLLGFKARFVPYILEGSKTHTIRAIRQKPPKVGEICHCYTGLRRRGPIIQKLASGDVVRQKMTRLLGRWPCVRVESITILDSLVNPSIPLLVWIGDTPLQPEEADQLFWRDGFRDEGGETYTHLHQAADFWKGRLPFRGHVIHWRWTEPTPADGRRPAATNKQ
jgi:hypothetical protein